MPNDTFDLIFASDRENIRPISDINYRTGWNHLGTNNVQTDDHDFVMRMQDEKSKWLYNQIGFNIYNNVFLPDTGLGGLSQGPALLCVSLASPGLTLEPLVQGQAVFCSPNTTIQVGNFNTVFGSPNATIHGSSNFLHYAPNSEVTGQGNLVMNVIGADVTGYGCLLFDADSASFAGSVTNAILVGSSGNSIDNCNGVLSFLSPSTSFANSNSSASLCNGGSISISGSDFSTVMSSATVTLTDTDRSVVLSSASVEIDAYDSVTVLSSQNVKPRKANTVVLGYGASPPSEDNITIELDAETGNVECKSVTINGVPLSPGGDTTGLAKKTVVIPVSTATHNIDTANESAYHRFTFSGAKTVTVRPNSTHALATDGAWPIANRSASGNLTVTPQDGSVIINGPFGGSLVLAPGMMAVLQKVGANEYDLIGQTVAI